MADDAPSSILALPAAPPRNTDWFAVDELGHVAMFRTGELGVLPEVAASHWPRGSSLAVDLVPLLGEVDPAALSYEAAHGFAAADVLGIEILDAPPRFDQSLAGVLLQLRVVAGARERLAGYGLHVLPSREGGYAWGEIDTPALRVLWQEGWIRRAWLGHAIEPSRMGMFLFECSRSLFPNDYERWDVPSVPVRVHALPTSLRRRLAAVRFAEVDFRQAKRLRANRASAAESG